MGQAGIQEMLRGVTIRTALTNADSIMETDAPPSHRYSMALHMLFGKRRILQNYTELMDAVTAQARQPYAANPPPLPVPSDPFTELIAPIFTNKGRVGKAKGEAQNGLLLLALALHAYRLEHGRYPVTLAELVPVYVKKIPADPFALQGVFGYRIAGNKFVLYSVGPDGKDNGGVPIDDPKWATPANPKGRYRVMVESQGDIVAGVNF